MHILSSPSMVAPSKIRSNTSRHSSGLRASNPSRTASAHCWRSFSSVPLGAFPADFAVMAGYGQKSHRTVTAPRRRDDGLPRTNRFGQGSVGVISNFHEGGNRQTISAFVADLSAQPFQ